MIMKTKHAMFSAAGLLLAVGTQAATVTSIGAPAAGEKNHAQIFGDIFGGVFVQNGNDFSNGVVNMVRVDDDLDQTYNFGTWSAKAWASWAAASQSFGTTDDGQLFNVTGDEASVGGSINNVSGDGSVVFSRFGTKFNTTTVSTDPTLNGDGLDHVVTYRLQNLQNDRIQEGGTYYLFFEDLLKGAPRYDFDYNDLVVEVTGVVPEPTSLALLGLGGLAMLRRRR